jgi:hypothetical protein
MRFFLLRQREAGRLLPRWRAGHLLPISGELLVADGHDPRLRRSAVVARFVDPATTDDLVPRLIDARVIFVRHATMVLAGVETVDEQDFAQTWMLTARAEDAHALA